MTPNQLMQLLVKRRKQLGLKHRYAAERCDMEVNHYIRIEKCKRGCTLDTFLKMLNGLGLEIQLNERQISQEEGTPIRTGRSQQIQGSRLSRRTKRIPGIQGGD